MEDALKVFFLNPALPTNTEATCNRTEYVWAFNGWYGFILTQNKTFAKLKRNYVLTM